MTETEQDLCHLDNESFSVTMTANEWAAIGQMLAEFLSRYPALDVIISAHEKIVKASKKFIEENVR